MTCARCGAEIDDSGVRLPEWRGEKDTNCPDCEERPCQCATRGPQDCPAHGIAASNARQNRYWIRVGGHD